MATVSVDDINVNVETVGAGVPLVLLHGSFMNALGWEAQLDGLADDFHVIAPEMRGHGGTPCPLTGRSFDRARDVIGVLDGLHIPQAIIGGHSMGGPIALQVALDYPERCLGLVLLATGSGPPDRPLIATPKARAAAEADAQRLLDLGTVEYFRTTTTSTAPGVKEFLENADYRRRFEAILEHNNPAFLADWIRMGGVDIPLELESHLTSHRRRRISEITMPVLFMVGDLDAVFLPVADSLRSQLPHTEIEVLPGATHLLTIDAADDVNRRITQFGHWCASPA